MKIIKTCFAISILIVLFSSTRAWAQHKNLMVRMAKIEVDSAQLENYKAILKTEIETSVRVESGVLSLNAVADKNNPTHITILEVYANVEAYKAHIETPHFKIYKTSTKEMVKSLQLIELDPIILANKLKNP